MLKKLNQEGTTIVQVTHSGHECEVRQQDHRASGRTH